MKDETNTLEQSDPNQQRRDTTEQANLSLDQPRMAMFVRKDLLQFCKYFDGTDEIKYEFDDIRGTAAKIEFLWMREMSREDSAVPQACEDYIRYGLEDFRKDDGVPMTLKAILMNRFFQYTERDDVEAFKAFYLKLY